MKLRFFTALAGASVICLAAGASQAAVTFIGHQTDVNAGETLVTEFEGGPSLVETLFLQAGYELSGNAQLFTGSTSGLSAAPATTATTRDTSQYLSVQKGQTATLDTPLLSAISFYIGSLDGYNSFTFRLANGTTEVVTGAILDALPGTQANGDQTAFTTNGRLTFSFDSAIDSIDFGSGNNSLEISDIGAISAVGLVPEPAAWAMMLLGFGGMGALLRRRRPAMVTA